MLGPIVGGAVPGLDAVGGRFTAAEFVSIREPIALAKRDAESVRIALWRNRARCWLAPAQQRGPGKREIFGQRDGFAVSVGLGQPERVAERISVPEPEPVAHHQAADLR